MKFRDGDIVSYNNNLYILCNIKYWKDDIVDKADFFCLINGAMYKNIDGAYLDVYKIL